MYGRFGLWVLYISTGVLTSFAGYVVPYITIRGFAIKNPLLAHPNSTAEVNRNNAHFESVFMI